ncbi:hypothetical protein INT44_006241, partial [Umbelopsis vinacea]
MALASTTDGNDHDTIHSADSDDGGMHTPQHHMNPIQDYLNSSPLDHGPPELSTISEQYGDPSSPSQRASAVRNQQNVRVITIFIVIVTITKTATSDINLITPISKHPPKPTSSSHKSVTRRLRLSASLGPAERLVKKDDNSPSHREDARASPSAVDIYKPWNRHSLDNLPPPLDPLETEIARSEPPRYVNTERAKQSAQSKLSTVNNSPDSSSPSERAISSSSSTETTPESKSSPQPRKRIRTGMDDRAPSASSNGYHSAPSQNIIPKYLPEKVTDRSALKDIIKSGKMDIPKLEDLRKQSIATTSYATISIPTHLDTMYTRHNSPDLRSELQRENSTEKQFAHSRNSLPGSLTLNNTPDVKSRPYGDRRHLERFSSASEYQTKDSTLSRSYMNEQERRALVRQQEQERLERAEREKERLERQEREKIERELERRERERRDSDYRHDQDHNRKGSGSGQSLQPPNARHMQDSQAPMPPPKAVPTPNWKTTLVNKHWYTVLDQLGKGGTGRVWRVMSHTHHRVFALKHVSLADVDSEATISSYINEIRLLERLSGHSRIVKLYDYEVNQQNGYIQMILECGELDMNTLLAKQQGKPINLNFIRMYWEQMLEAVHAIHQQKIVHSDLKPANFILVQGALKLIDFGIAKAIPNDTTNIQRDIQVGTLNYMSPEAIKDSQAGQHGGREMMKLGRPSDVWSLGCILYQMVYGRTPFHHVKGMWQKLACISNPSHEIEFPKIAVPIAPPVRQPDGTLVPAEPLSPTKNGVRVEADLLNVMKYCLQRDPKQRKTIPQLLKDPFIKPDQVLKQLYEHAYKQGSAGQPLDADSMDKAIE